MNSWPETKALVEAAEAVELMTKARDHNDPEFNLGKWYAARTHLSTALAAFKEKQSQPDLVDFAINAGREFLESRSAPPPPQPAVGVRAVTPLKPCPFCAGPAELEDDDHSDGWCGRCNRCDFSLDFVSREQAIENWNNRPTLTPSPSTDELARDQVKLAGLDTPAARAEIDEREDGQ